MARSMAWPIGAALLLLSPAGAAAQPITLLPTSLVRVRADNHFGVTKDTVTTPPVFAPGTFVNSVVDTEMGTAAAAVNVATYEISLTGTTAVFDIQTVQSHTVGATGNLTEGFLQFTLTEPFVYQLSGQFFGASADAGDAYQQRTFLRRFETPFDTVYLEDETRVGTAAALYVNLGSDTGNTAGSSFNQSGPLTGVLLPGTYEFAYELESNDRDVDQAVEASALGRVRLVLRKPLAPSNLQAVTNGRNVALSWTASPDAGAYVLQAGSASGASDVFAAPIGPGVALQAPVPPGTYFVRLSTVNGAATGPPTEDVTFSIAPAACSAPPPAPLGHAVSTGGPTVQLRWGSAPGATSYVLEAGTAPSVTNIASLDVGGRTTFTIDAPPLTYYTRVRAVNACGSSAPSNEVSFTACVPPAAPVLTLTRPGGSMRLAWTASLGTAAYVLQVGTVAGASNVFSGSFGASTAVTVPAGILPPGIYFMRVIAASTCGVSAASPELVVTFP